MISTSSTNKPLNAVVICGPSGVGKGTMLQRLFAQYPDRFAYSVSHTTRAPRPKEVNGREYHFTDKETILRMRDNNEFLELCEVHGNYYGTSMAAVNAIQEENKTCIIEIDVCGAQKLASRVTNPGETPLSAVYFFITAPKEELRKRIIGRGCDDDACLQRRLATAETEYAFVTAHPEFFSAVIVNDELEEAFARLVHALNAVFVRHQMAPLDPSPAPAM